jgi:hypothetical protein
LPASDGELNKRFPIEALRGDVDNFAVRNCRICQLKSLDPSGLLVVFFLRRYASLQFDHGGIGMKNKLLNCLIAGALGTALALASPALAFRGGGGGGGMHGGGMGGGMHGGGMGGGMHVGGMGGGVHVGGMGGGMHVGGMGGGMHVGGMSRGMHFGGMSGGTHFSGSRFAGAHAGFSPRFSRFAFHDGFHHGFHHRFFHHRFHRFAFFGAPYYSYASYDSCWRRVWTSYGPQWVNICGDYGY